jgi:hypothetical protein
MLFVHNTIRLPGNPHGQGCRTVSFIQKISSRSFFVILKFACDICMQIKPYNGTSVTVNQHGICSTKVYLRPRAISKAMQIHNLKSACLLVVKMPHCAMHLKLRILLLLATRSVQKCVCFSCFLALSQVRPMAILEQDLVDARVRF